MLVAIGIASTIDGTSGQGLLHEHRQQNPHSEEETVTPMSDFDEEAGRFCPLAVLLCRQSILQDCALACPALPCPALPCACSCWVTITVMEIGITHSVPAVNCALPPCPALGQPRKTIFRPPHSCGQKLPGLLFRCCSWHSSGGDTSSFCHRLDTGQF